MTYQICERNGNAVTEIPCEEKFAAQGWALEWARAKASADEYIIKQDGNNCARLFHSMGGQWYLMNA